MFGISPSFFKLLYFLFFVSFIFHSCISFSPLPNSIETLLVYSPQPYIFCILKYMWLHHLLLPFCYPSKSVIKDYSIYPFYTEVYNLNNLYVIEFGISRSYYKKFWFLSTPKLVRHTSVVVMDIFLLVRNTSVCRSVVNGDGYNYSTCRSMFRF